MKAEHVAELIKAHMLTTCKQHCMKRVDSGTQWILASPTRRTSAYVVDNVGLYLTLTPTGWLMLANKNPSTMNKLPPFELLSNGIQALQAKNPKHHMLLPIFLTTLQNLVVSPYCWRYHLLGWQKMDKLTWYSPWNFIPAGQLQWGWKVLYTLL